MSKSVGIHVTAINETFYKNVFLLTQLVPPSAEFQRHFKQNMFDKPNTEGFVHVSHYLSCVYDEDLFEQMVMWPISCRMGIMMYRIEIKNFFSTLSRNNPDLKFSPILMSHLIESGGTKFLVFMWKLSQLALRAYIKKRSQTGLLNKPCVSPLSDTSTTYLNNVIVERRSAAMEAHDGARKILDTAVNFINDEIEVSNVYKSEIFDGKENIKGLAQDASVHPLLQERLMDIEDTNVINEWKGNIREGVLYVRKKNEELSKLSKSCSCLCKLVLRICSNSKIFDANEFPEYNNYSFLLRTEPELTCNLYAANGSITFQALFSLLRLASTQMLYRVNDADSSYLSQCLLVIQNARKDIESLQTMFAAVDTRVAGIFMGEYDVAGRNRSIDFDMDGALVVKKDMLLQSPRINFDFEQYADDNLFFKMCVPPPTEGERKNLFKRCKRKYCPSRDSAIASSDFNVSVWKSTNKWRSSCTYFPRREQITSNGKLISPLYFRLLHQPRLNSKRSRDSTPFSPILNQEGPSKRRRSISETIISNNYSRRNLVNFTAKSSYSSSWIKK